MRRNGSLRRAWLFVLALPFAVCGAVSSSAEAAGGFPFDHELRLDANPQRGSKRVPGMQISEDGAVEIDLWCVSGKGRAAIAADTITIVPVAMRDNRCSADQLRMDEDLLAKITQVTAWRREGDAVVFIGPQTLRFRLTSN